jgi:hypothetical protein
MLHLIELHRAGPRGAIKKSRDQTLQNYLRNLNHYDKCIWKPVRATNKPIASVQPLRIQTKAHSELWARSDKEKADENRPDQATEEDITTLPQNILPIKLLSPEEIKEVIFFLNIEKHLVSIKPAPK